jgi:hypothetical protein
MATPPPVVANREIVKVAAASNSLLQRILQRIFRFPGLKTSNSAQIGQEFHFAQGTEQGFPGISRQSFEQIRVTGRFMKTRVSRAAK